MGVGIKAAKEFCLNNDNIPLIGVHHLEAHALVTRLINKVKFPFLLLLVSGGHTQIIQCKSIGKYEILGVRYLDFKICNILI